MQEHRLKCVSPKTPLGPHPTLLNEGCSTFDKVGESWNETNLDSWRADHQSCDNQTCKRKEEAERGEDTESRSKAKAVWSQQMD